MNCSRPECQTTAGCKCGPYWPAPIYVSPRLSMPVQMPVPYSGMFTVAVMDKDGGLQIKVDQPPAPTPITEEEDHAIKHAEYQVKRATPENSEVRFDYELVQNLLDVIERFSAR